MRRHNNDLPQERKKNYLQPDLSSSFLELGNYLSLSVGARMVFENQLIISHFISNCFHSLFRRWYFIVIPSETKN